ncbi:MAG: alpha-N-arabinofuranosidase, partial [Tepidisphaeraceae bacterium]
VGVASQAGNSTTLWQPLPDGPVITIPAGSTSIPVASVNGFSVGEKIGIGYGATYPAVANTVEQYEVVTVTDVGKAGTQAFLAADAKAGDTNIKVTSVANISVGDKIRLDIDSVGHGIETVTVTKVGTARARGRGAGADLGTGLDIDAPLKLNHAANLPFSDRGTGISFQPATAFAHSSNEPVRPLGAGITLDAPLANDHAIDAVVHDAAATTAGYQWPVQPNQWFGGPALAQAGSMVLRDANGLVVDSLNYGGIVDPWAAQGYQGVSGPGRNGCFVPSPAAPGGRGGRGRGAAPANPTNRVVSRTTDGADTGSNCADFAVHTSTTQPAIGGAPAPAAANQ